ncbi:MAG: hypothetical protein Roseis2KO_08780 [Roseivirga sp.]
MQRTIFGVFAILLLSLSGTNQSFSQSSDSVKTESVTRLELMTVGVSRELAISQNTTLFGKIGLFSTLRSTIALIDRSGSGISTHWFPVVDLQYRKYTNLGKRAAKGKSIKGNTGNYLSIKALAYLPELLPNSELDDAVSLGPMWGMQRQFNDQLSLDLAAGLGYQFRFDLNNRIIPLITFNMAYRLSK